VELGREKIDVEIHPGSVQEAIQYAAGANATHGKRRTNADKRNAVRTLLSQEPWNTWSAREVAKICRVNHSTVQRIRDQLNTTGHADDCRKATMPNEESAASGGEAANRRGTVKTKDGRQYPAKQRRTAKRKPKPRKERPKLGTAERPYPADTAIRGQDDDNGNVVPEELEDVFQSRSEFIRISAGLRELAAALQALSITPAGQYVATEDVGRLRKVAERVLAAKPSVLSDQVDHGWTTAPTCND
jgi:hypothetical protein